MDDLDRVFQRLVQNLKSRSGDHVTQPFTVAELYEQIIPYRHNRRELGIETNQDYEMAVIRLLSGERDYITGDDAMQDALKKEMGSQNPDTGAFREYATTQVSISPAALESKPSRPATPAQQRPADPSAPSAQAAAPAAPVAAAGSVASATATAKDTSMLDNRVQEKDAPAPAARPGKAPTFGNVGELTAPEGCRYCSGTLPEGKDVTFCPHCGQNLSLNQCPACGTEMEHGWKFCIGCGRPDS